MTQLDDLPDRLRTQMRSATASDAAPPDLLERIHRSVGRRRRKQAGGLAVVAGAAAVGVLTLSTQGAPSQDPETLAGPRPPAADLSVLRSDDGRLSVQVTSAGEGERTERVELPGYVRNNAAEPVTVLALSVPGTTLRAELPPQLLLVPGGRLPLTLTRLVDCEAAPSLPAQLDVRVTARGGSGETSVLLPLPEEVVTQYRSSHACSAERRAADDAEAAARAAEEARREADAATQPAPGG